MVNFRKRFRVWGRLRLRSPRIMFLFSHGFIKPCLLRLLQGLVVFGDSLRYSYIWPQFVMPVQKQAADLPNIPRVEFRVSGAAPRDILRAKLSSSS